MVVSLLSCFLRSICLARLATVLVPLEIFSSTPVAGALDAYGQRETAVALSQSNLRLKCCHSKRCGGGLPRRGRQPQPLIMMDDTLSADSVSDVDGDEHAERYRE